MSGAIKIPNKSLFKMNEVCSLTGVKPYVLRFWESEFEEIAPVTSSSGQRMYEHKDIEAVAYIKKLLFEDKLTIDKAKQEMKTGFTSSPSQNESDDPIDSFIENSSKDELVERSISEKDIEKLSMAKDHLKELLATIDSIKGDNNWIQALG